MTQPSNDSAANNQTLIGHLLELRQRLLRVVALVLGIFIFLMVTRSYRHIYDWIAAPLMDALPEGTSMIATHVTSPLLVPMQLAFYVSLFIGMPYILHQLWAFVSPGLYRREQRLTLPLLTSSILLFYAGCAFAYFAIFPVLFGFFTSVAPDGVAVMTEIGSYLSFVIALFIAFGVTFELPVFIYLLVASGIVSREAIADKRRFVIVGCFVVAMFLTPPDVFSQTLMAIPMYLLFEIGLLASRLAKPGDDNDGNDADTSPH